MKNYGEKITVENRQALLLHERVITNPLVIRAAPGEYIPWFVSLLPGDAIHTLEHVTIDAPYAMLQLMYRLFFSVDTAYDKVFHIKKLHGIDLGSSVLRDFLENDPETYTIEDMMVYVARQPVLREDAHRKHRVIFTLRHADGGLMYIRGMQKKADVTFEEITEKQAQKEKDAMVQHIQKKQNTA